MTDVLKVHTEIAQDPSGNGLVLADDGEQDVLGSDVVVAEAQRLLQRQRKQLLGARCERDRIGTVSCSPLPTLWTTRSRVSSSVMPNDASARAATPFRTANKPNNRCSLPT